MKLQIISILLAIVAFVATVLKQNEAAAALAILSALIMSIGVYKDFDKMYRD